MLELFIELLRHTLTLFFGVFVSASFLGIAFNKKNIFLLSIFSVLNLALQGIVFFTFEVSVTRMVYPLITHFPLFLLFLRKFKKNALASLLAIAITYLCCQVAKWISAISQTLYAPYCVTNIVYSFTLIITCLFLIRYVIEPFAKLLTKPTQSLFSFGIVPIFYYIFDYVTTVYTDILYAGNRIATEFSPLLLSICYITFCIVYFKQYEEKQEMQNITRMTTLQYEQSKKELKRMKQNEKSMTLLRHDMRHFLNNISTYIEQEESEKALEYIRSVMETVDTTRKQKYCSNEIVNTILSSYEDTMTENGITFRYSIRIPKELTISDIDMTSILSNALENAIHAVLPLNRECRIIDLQMKEKSGKLLLSIENTYDKTPVLMDGIPKTTQKDHGFGTESIRYTVEKLQGNCQFSLRGEKFVLQIIL